MKLEETSEGAWLQHSGNHEIGNSEAGKDPAEIRLRSREYDEGPIKDEEDNALEYGLPSSDTVNPICLSG
ncbi:hypothetical protein Fmac_006016 [Flemingia macrophylla]|uniref:Uncharacterized protein n=1 Tax=Flemingia macrophylla TaxID=520843 RepID=A0ABD1N9X5_9FABA